MFTPNNVVPEKTIKYQEVPKAVEQRLVALPDTTPSNLEVVVVDAPGPNGANHHYKLRGFDLNNNPSLLAAQSSGNGMHIVPKREINLFLQTGALQEGNEHSFNGVTIEMLLAVCKEHLESIQSGPLAGENGDIALGFIHGALETLHEGTRERKAAKDLISSASPLQDSEYFKPKPGEVLAHHPV